MKQVNSCMYKIYELRDYINNSLTDVAKIIDQQEELADIVENAEKKSIDDSFVEDLRTSINRQKDEVANLQTKLELVNFVITNYEADKANGGGGVNAIVSSLLILLGVCNLETEENEAEETTGEVNA